MRLLGRVGQYVLVVWLAFTLSFFLLYVLPSDAASLMVDPTQVGDNTETVERLREFYGLDHSVWHQYADKLVGMLHGDFGVSYRTGQDAWSMISAVLPNTTLLAGLALVLAVLLALGVALLSVQTAFPRLGGLASAIPSVAVSVPVFLVGLLLIHLFAMRLGWFPVIGGDGPSSLVLPAITLAVPVAAPIAQLLVRNLSRELAAPYVTVLRAQGASTMWILRRNALKNACLPALTIAGLTFGQLLAGTVIVETVFSRTGLGRLTETAVRNQDIALIQAIVVLGAVVFSLVNLAVDVVYPILDPRVKVGHA
ncbi:peptide/nickel transport system permease protein [Asanoa ferruginea]|uniref:Peptide/nickel transport system permease protein n=1 Tax=Asanoa ferruginea TaxID=53367 RepID=A0A3D9ZNV6_9ACTN|nr:ABC transporter permease [Asanoa ferruginea]REF98304.1 peptide/nickel transport system permease protein [Asanoa ferruginea]GIF52042.1 peptide ABC transporter permease [Asanoa ferruginea]